MNNTPLGIYYMCDADVCSFVLVSRLFGLALEANRHVPRLILQDVATHILPHVLIAFEYTIDGTAIYLFIYYYSIKNEYIISSKCCICIFLIDILCGQNTSDRRTKY